MSKDIMDIKICWSIIDDIDRKEGDDDMDPLNIFLKLEAEGKWDFSLTYRHILNEEK